MSESVFEKLFDKLNKSHNEAIKELFRIQAVTVRALKLKYFFVHGKVGRLSPMVFCLFTAPYGVCPIRGPFGLINGPQ